MNVQKNSRMNTIRSFFIRWFNTDYLIVTLSLFISVSLLGLLTFNLTIFNPISKALTDFNFCDLLYSRMNSEHEMLDTNIVLVNIGHLDRARIAEQIQIIRKHQPKVIGFDGFFSARRDSTVDVILQGQLCKSKIVMAVYLTGKNELDAKFDKLEISDPWFSSGVTGFVNLGGSNPTTSTVRYFSPSEVFRGRTLEAFGVEIVKRYNPDAVRYLKDRNNDREVINYIGNKNAFISFDANEILDSLADLEIIKDKIVLMGYIGESFQSRPDLEDIYYTPMNPELTGRSIPDMYGVVIHANIINMILKRNYINSMPVWLCIVLSYILCYFYISFITWFNDRKQLLFNVTFPFFLLLLNIVIVYIFFLLYEYCNYSINSGYFLAPIILFKTFLSYYERGLAIINRYIKIRSIFLPKE